MMFDFDLESLKLRPEDDLRIRVALFSSQVIRIIELLDDEKCIEEARERLVDRASAIKEHLEEKLSDTVHAKRSIDQIISVEGAIVFPFKTRSSKLVTSPNVTVLYRDELSELMNLFRSEQISKKVTTAGKIAISEMLNFSFFQQQHNTLIAQSFFCQRKLSNIYSRVTFNSIMLTDTQHQIKKDLLADDRPKIVWGSYGTGKSVAVASALKELIEKSSKTNILFLSAQSLLNVEDLRLSPYLLMIERWVKDICHQNVEILNYMHFLDKSLDQVVQTKCQTNKSVIFCSYLLKHADVDINNLRSVFRQFQNFDVVVLEETHVLKLNMLEELVTQAGQELKEKHMKVWIVSNAEKLGSISPGFKITPKAEQQNLRNQPEIAKLAEAVNSGIGSERYPSAAMSSSSDVCLITPTYEYEGNDEHRLNRIVSLAIDWKWRIPSASVLFIDCENSGLLRKLRTNGIDVDSYRDSKSNWSYLLLENSDPIEAIVAGAEWHVLIVHIKIKTLLSICAVRLFSKRIISRATTNLYIFSDTDLDISQSAKKNNKDNGKTVVKGDNPSSDYRSAGNNDSGVDIKSVVNCIKKIPFKAKQTKAVRSYKVMRLRDLDDSLSNLCQDICLFRTINGLFLIVQLTSDMLKKDEVMTAQKLVHDLWNVKLPAYLGCVLVSSGETMNVSRISRVLQLRKVRLRRLKYNTGSGGMPIDTDLFAKQGKYFSLSLYAVPCRTK